eukprot:CAMPEP_0179207602 /NCGR_PEP_ID=MMETSP0796-20121207/103526_1 /TAXON_ID=73915 /ORGANISM="Pyrodinium bahamense, Strain pbaha01" /LENGTH=276 /DNA_ID=CAMNT_0020912541 /DNA_START=289 /DNA_END=1119 /DNA_ORIENTATION=-
MGVSTGNAWVKEGSYREQPLVSFTHELLLSVSNGNATDSVGWSTRKDFDALLPGRIKVPSVRSTPYDKNRDGIPDTWELTLQIPTGSVSKGYEHVFLLAAYNYELRERVREQIGGLVVIDVSSPFPATGVWVRGELRLRQASPLRVTSEVREVYAWNPLILDWTSNKVMELHPITVHALLEGYAARNETVYLNQVTPPAWDYSPQDSFSIHVVFDVPAQLVYYVPGIFEVLKFGWMQLMALALPVWAALSWVKEFAFDNQIVESYVVAGLPPKHAM